MSVGAHDLILHILEPSLESRATLHDIATHPWLQDRPRQDPKDLYMISPLDLSSSYTAKQTRDSIDENTDKSSPVSDGNRMHFYSDYHGTMARISVASSLDDSLALWENDEHCVSVSRSCGPNVYPLNVEHSSHCMQDKVISGDYIPLHDNSVIDDCQRLSAGDTFNKDFCRIGYGDAVNNDLMSGLRTPSDFYFQPASNNAYCNHQQLPDSGQVVASGALSTATEMAKLPVSFSADSLEVFADSRPDDASCNDSNTDEYHDCDAINVQDLADANDIDTSDIDDSRCECYDFADIDAVLDHIASDVVASAGTDVDEGSQVSYDSLDDAV